VTVPVPSRIYCIPALEVPVVAVFRRGPTHWSHVGRWDLAGLTYESGAWLGGRIFPRRCDLSPDGRFLSYFAHKPSATWELGEAYVAVSKLPWLTALHAFATCGTWTRGYFFTPDASATHARSLGSADSLQAAVHPRGAVRDRATAWLGRSAGLCSARSARCVGSISKRPNAEAPTRRSPTPLCREYRTCRG
jgi:hypothetical protein